MLAPEQVKALIEVYQPELYRLAYSLTRSTDLAEKISAEALLAGLKQTARMPVGAAAVRGAPDPADDNQTRSAVSAAPSADSDMSLWLARRVVAACRWQNWLARVKVGLAEGIAALREQDGRDGPAEAGAAYSAAGLWPAYQALPPAGQRVLALRYFHTYPLPTIAFLLAQNQGSVARQLGEARSRLDSAAGGPHGMLGQYAPGLNHTQARQLLQSAVEQPVKGQPWFALQTHLETCPACRAYQQRLEILQRELGRALSPYLSPPQPVGPAASARLLAAWESSAHANRR